MESAVSVENRSIFIGVFKLNSFKIDFIHTHCALSWCHSQKLSNNIGFYDIASSFTLIVKLKWNHIPRKKNLIFFQVRKCTCSCTCKTTEMDNKWHNNWLNSKRHRPWNCYSDGIPVPIYNSSENAGSFRMWQWNESLEEGKKKISANLMYFVAFNTTIICYLLRIEFARSICICAAQEWKWIDQLLVFVRNQQFCPCSFRVTHRSIARLLFANSSCYVNYDPFHLGENKYNNIYF